MFKPKPRYVWGALFLIGGAYETYGIFNDSAGDTLSECTRAVFHVDGVWGQVAFVAFWTGFSAWFIPHIAFKAAGKAKDLS